MMQVKLLKLITGEDIICELEMTDIQVAHNPYSLAIHPEKGLVLMKFSPYAITEKVYFEKSSILCVLDPQEPIVNHYKELTGKIITPKHGIIV
tara:strand:- start:29 stop:307 length:279 start_codon:yes stop_codon:yes gene_type:complete